MVKLIHTPPPSRPTGTKWIFFGVLALLALCSGTLFVSYLMHNPDDPSCGCILCTLNGNPEEGEMLYNRFLPVISCGWLCILVLIVQITRHYKHK